MRRPTLLLITVLAACGGGSGGSDAPPASDAGPADANPNVPVFRNPVALPDDQLALQALQILGANVPNHDERCNGCHPMTRSHIRYWRTLSDTAMANCLTDLGVGSMASAHQMIDCVRTDPSNPSSNFTTPHLGVYASAARLPWFNYVFTYAYGGTTEYDDFVNHVGMPPGASPNSPLTQEQFDIVAEWFIRGIPMLDQTLPEDPAPTECFPNISPAVATHVAEQATAGWRAHNAAASMNMFDCAGSTDPKQCLTNQPLASTTAFGATWDVNGATNRILWQGTPGDGYRSDYWTRSSADGRFVGHGGGVSGFYSTVLDLQEHSTIQVHALYDPGFFPDNSGWLFQGASRNSCSMSVLQNAGTDVVMSSDPGCADLGSVGLYEHPGGVIGGDYFTVNGEFVSDNGGQPTTTRDPSSDFGSTSQIDIVPIIFNGTTYQTKPRVTVDIPYQGDAVISPSSDLILTRLGGTSGRQLGYVMLKLTKTPNASTYTITNEEVARYCLTGGKPAFSYDERWIAFHHYVSPTSDSDAQELGFADHNDAGYANYASRGTANVFLLDLATGTKTRLTNMKPGQYALYPHFRSDGWIYFQVRDNNAAGYTEYTVANDGALQLE